jgi:hypothetical protein
MRSTQLSLCSGRSDHRCKLASPLQARLPTIRKSLNHSFNVAHRCVVALSTFNMQLVKRHYNPQAGYPVRHCSLASISLTGRFRMSHNTTKCACAACMCASSAPPCLISLHVFTPVRESTRAVPVHSSVRWYLLPFSRPCVDGSRLPLQSDVAPLFAVRPGLQAINPHIDIKLCK